MFACLNLPVDCESSATYSSSLLASSSDSSGSNLISGRCIRALAAFLLCTTIAPSSTHSSTASGPSHLTVNRKKAPLVFVSDELVVEMKEIDKQKTDASLCNFRQFHIITELSFRVAILTRECTAHGALSRIWAERHVGAGQPPKQRHRSPTYASNTKVDDRDERKLHKKSFLPNYCQERIVIRLTCCTATGCFCARRTYVDP